MTRKLLLLFFLGVCMTLPVHAASPTVELSVSGDTVVTVKSLPFKVKAPAGADFYIWNHPSSVASSEDGDTLTVTAAPKGEVTVKVQTVTIDWAAKKVAKARGQITFVVGATPVPPDPGPTPTPPEPPGPTPGPAPIPLDGFRVLIIEDAKARSKLPAAQMAVLFDASLRDYLDGKCVAGSDGKMREWRIWPSTGDYSRVEKHWQDVMKRKRDSLPWIVISDGKRGYEGPLPADVDKTMELIKKYAPTSAKKGGR